MTDADPTPPDGIEVKNPPKKPSHIRRHAPNYAKLIAAIAALTAAINGYLDLAKKNELVYEALASKVNNMSEKLSNLEGQNQVILTFLQATMGNSADEMMKEIEDKLPPPVEEEDEASEGIGEGAEASKGAGLAPMEGVTKTMVAVEAEEAKPKKEKRVVIKAYQELPPKLDGLVQAQEQLQVQQAQEN